MQHGMVEGICRIGIFIVCAQAIVHFRPNGSYEKYLRMLVSVMILIQILKPLAGFLNGGSEDVVKERMAWFEEQLIIGRREAEKSREQVERRLEEMTLEEVRERLQEQIQEEVSVEQLQEAELSVGQIQEPEVPVEQIHIEVEIGGERDNGKAEGDTEEVVPQR